VKHAVSNTLLFLSVNKFYFRKIISTFLFVDEIITSEYYEMFAVLKLLRKWFPRNNGCNKILLKRRRQ
jgi:hypothetical protein